MSVAIDLLPERIHRKALYWLRIRQWCAAWVVIALLCLGTTGLLWVQVEWERDRLKLLENELAPVRAMQAKLEAMNRRLEELKSRQSMLTLLSRTKQPVQLIGIISKATVTEQRDVQVLDVRFAPATRTETAEVADAAGQVQRIQKSQEYLSLNLEALGKDDLAVARFIAALRESGVFESVTLMKSGHVDNETHDGRAFSVSCVIE